MTRTSLGSRAAQAGFTLIELMVSLLIGMVVVGALLAAYYVSFTSSRHSAAMSQIAEDATLALNVIRMQVAQAGYSPLTGAPPNTTRLHNTFTMITGCEGANFVNANAANGTATCPAAGTGPDAIEVAYEANSSGAVNGILVGGVPADCVGNAITAQGSPAWYLNDSKFYVDTTSHTLYCHGPGTTSADAAPLVDNVEDLQIRYGIGGANWGLTGAGQVAYYATADAVGSSWASVAAVSICVQVRSANKVINADSTDPLAAYIDCSDQPQQSSDGYLRRTFSTTVVLQSMTL
jgi:type IV pilus assembly protein PilW